ncbi:MAG: hypothetical protein M1818_000824 [Claussenomyces sp. TS43310]|nr:MAG: hypothetical protein M1818_000824 [Claussenomyces sp. TS43310]
MDPYHCGTELRELNEADCKANTASTNLSNSRKGGNGLFNKLFNRQSSKPLVQEIENTDDVHNVDRDSDGGGDFIVTPCPYIRPLENKLSPRIEVSNRMPRTPTSYSTITSTFESGQVRRDAIWRQSPISLNEAVKHVDDEVASQKLMQLRDLSYGESVAAAAAYDLSYLRAWNYYIKCYSEGRFNVISPPDPPPRDPKFSFLPAVYPVNEAERLKAFEHCKPEWNDWTSTRAKDLVLEALLQFDAPWAAISFFDRKSELIMAELGYNRQYICRQESIAAHVLFSTDVMVILDTKQDWRFSGNPMVAGRREVRFFAGAPLLAETGEVIGVFAIFGPDVRNKFTSVQRHALFEFGMMAARDLTTAATETIDDRQRETPILQREDLINGTTAIGKSPRITSHKHAQSVNPGLSLSSLTYNKQRTAALARQSLDAVSDLSEPTPPDSDDSDSDFNCPEQRSNKTVRNLLLHTGNVDQFGEAFFTPKSLAFVPVSPRPFSSSDLTSVEDMPRCCTPETPSNIPVDLTLLRDTELADQGASADSSMPSVLSDQYFKTTDSGYTSARIAVSGTTAPPESSNQDQKVQHETSIAGIVFPKDDTQNDSINGGVSASHICQACINSVYSDITTGNTESLDTHVEAGFAAAFWARNLGFDTVYAVEICPSQALMTDKELKAPGGMLMRLVVSYGLEEDVSFSASMHLQALRTTGVVIWDDDGSCPGEYRRGFMMALAYDKAVPQDRSRGLIFGAFRKTPENGELAAVITTVEINRLRDAAMVLKKILMKPMKIHPRRCQTAPSSPSGFLADEATEVDKHSLEQAPKI